MSVSFATRFFYLFSLLIHNAAAGIEASEIDGNKCNVCGKHEEAAKITGSNEVDDILCKNMHNFIATLDAETNVCSEFQKVFAGDCQCIGGPKEDEEKNDKVKCNACGNHENAGKITDESKMTKGGLTCGALQNFMATLNATSDNCSLNQNIVAQECTCSGGPKEDEEKNDEVKCNACGNHENAGKITDESKMTKDGLTCGALQNFMATLDAKSDDCSSNQNIVAQECTCSGKITRKVKAKETGKGKEDEEKNDEEKDEEKNDEEKDENQEIDEDKCNACGNHKRAGKITDESKKTKGGLSCGHLQKFMATLDATSAPCMFNQRIVARDCTCSGRPKKNKDKCNACGNHKNAGKITNKSKMTKGGLSCGQLQDFMATLDATSDDCGLNRRIVARDCTCSGRPKEDEENNDEEKDENQEESAGNNEEKDDDDQSNEEKEENEKKSKKD